MLDFLITPTDVENDITAYEEFEAKVPRSRCHQLRIGALVTVTDISIKIHQAEQCFQHAVFQ